MTGRDLTRQVVVRVPNGTAATSRGVAIPGFEDDTYTEIIVNAKRSAVSADEMIEQQRLSATEISRWITAYDTRITSDCLLVDEEGTEWNIKAVQEMGRRAFLDLRCSRR